MFFYLIPFENYSLSHNALLVNNLILFSLDFNYLVLFPRINLTHRTLVSDTNFQYDRFLFFIQEPVVFIRNSIKLASRLALNIKDSQLPKLQLEIR